MNKKNGVACQEIGDIIGTEFNDARRRGVAASVDGVEGSGTETSKTGSCCGEKKREQVPNLSCIGMTGGRLI